jgi:hypothetical protein
MVLKLERRWCDFCGRFYQPRREDQRFCPNRGKCRNKAWQKLNPRTPLAELGRKVEGEK